MTGYNLKVLSPTTQPSWPQDFKPSRGKTDTCYVISTFNIDPTPLVKFTKNFFVYDRSDDYIWITKNSTNPTLNAHYRLLPNVGHNITDIFLYIVENYENLPRRCAFIKANIVPRLVTPQYWSDSYDRQVFTYLWCDPIFQNKENIAYKDGSRLLERNSSWYVAHSNLNLHFKSLDEFMDYFFEDYHSPEYVSFSPGANYIVERERILLYPKEFWSNLIKVVDYGFFPSEAWILERALGMIFEGYFHVREESVSESHVEDFLSRRRQTPFLEKSPAGKSAVTIKTRLSWKLRSLALKLSDKSCQEAIVNFLKRNEGATHVQLLKAWKIDSNQLDKNVNFLLQNGLIQKSRGKYDLTK
jgi:Protein of unknown function (DUF3431)